MNKAKIASLALVGGLSIAAANPAGGVFVGINAGVPITTPNYSGALDTIKAILPDSGVGYAVGVNAGYRHALTSNYGLRYYAEYNYGDASGNGEGTLAMLAAAGNPNIKTKATFKQHLATANIDFYYNVTSLFGFYVGVGVGYQSFTPQWTAQLPTAMGGDQDIKKGTKGGIAVPINVGFSINPAPKHQITIGAKIPTIAYNYDAGDVTIVNNLGNGKVKLKTYFVQVGYNFTF